MKVLKLNGVNYLIQQLLRLCEIIFDATQLFLVSDIEALLFLLAAADA